MVYLMFLFLYNPMINKVIFFNNYSMIVLRGKVYEEKIN